MRPVAVELVHDGAQIPADEQEDGHQEQPAENSAGKGEGSQLGPDDVPNSGHGCVGSGRFDEHPAFNRTRLGHFNIITVEIGYTRETRNLKNCVRVRFYEPNPTAAGKKFYKAP